MDFRQYGSSLYLNERTTPHLSKYRKTMTTVYAVFAVLYLEILLSPEVTVARICGIALIMASTYFVATYFLVYRPADAKPFHPEEKRLIFLQIAVSLLISAGAIAMTTANGLLEIHEGVLLLQLVGILHVNMFKQVSRGEYVKGSWVIILGLVSLIWDVILKVVDIVGGRSLKTELITTAGKIITFVLWVLEKYL
ncbi:MAG: hypothetical protein D6698_13350 [Gammaproteobacteria bacterium]|nr:MAG: hypothetical protein D6698_13350 [Gammaproteobacteria bacterium]